jgi:hypothetical protein
LRSRIEAGPVAGFRRFDAASRCGFRPLPALDLKPHSGARLFAAAAKIISSVLL